MIYVYANGNIENHGCEALSKTIPMILSEDIEEYVINPLPSKLGCVKQQKSLEMHSNSFLHTLRMAVNYHLKNWDKYYGLVYQDFLRNVDTGDICISIGGDNYCYGDIKWLQSLNRILSRKSTTILLGNSIEPDLLDDTDVVTDLKKYKLIVARESLTFDSLIAHGLLKNTVLYPDSAFVLPMESCQLPEGLINNETVGINISPTIIQAGQNENAVFDAYVKLLEYIINKKKMHVALIPHVVWKRSDDREPLMRLYDRFKDTGKVCMINDMNCMQLKYAISKCRFMVAARTHASIAAYSSCVPTLVMGYSIKAKGIAKDLFGTYENYVLSAQELENPEALQQKFCWLESHEQEIRQRLRNIMPEYQNRVYGIKDEILKIKKG